ncbi:hypothetical protein [Sandaracinus amylolyticus]|uniref:Uncharacterized protein n=1 Tax=Sandaracinus amylolyticus TaxID=927083 RepID=A0A0F6W6Q7_9BACT|nr:hypothetical protein [Sandaracinus amylolyticus]AKF08836.1 hypothetical protein DB32_005985 [Sandaracinus amylolyticus]
MSDSRYPLEAARTLRAEEQEVAERALAAAISAHDAAQRARERAEETRRAHAAETERVAREERALDGRTALDLMRLEEWIARRRREERTLASRVSHASETERTSERAVEEARAALATVRAEREAVERHHGAWLDARRRTAEQKEQDEADERASRRR